MASRLFVYGTLHPKRAPREIATLVREFQPLGEGTVRGHLYDFGAYPAVILDRKGESIKGTIFALPTRSDALARLDAYEEFLPETPNDSLFLRRKTKVKLEDGSLQECWIYVYNKPVPAKLSSQLASVA